MNIKLKQFGNILTSRQDGREALAALEPELRNITSEAKIVLDFEGVDVFTPSWGDEFITKLTNRFGTQIVLENTENASVQETLKIIQV